jgi:hypothetical protein
MSCGQLLLCRRVNWAGLTSRFTGLGSASWLLRVEGKRPAASAAPVSGTVGPMVVWMWYNVVVHGAEAKQCTGHRESPYLR